MGSDPIGAGMYILCSQLNHDCLNNCSYWTENEEMHVVNHVVIPKN